MSDDKTTRFEAPPDEGSAPTEANETTRRLGSQTSHSRSIGGYRLHRRLGEGGMGVVYEAEQQNPKRSVALKVIRGGAHVGVEQARLFQREIQALARLRHPGIAAIYESGCTDEGQHFFAMELVRGQTLTEYLRPSDRHLARAELEQVLRLFRVICDAVNYAHQRGVIHRDLKPSNILVLSESSSSGSFAALPEIRILDFGLARITDADINTVTMVTEAGRIQGTLAYMSPEQVRGNSDEIDIRTDVYSLGVLLYEMLTGTLPQPLEATTLHQAMTMVLEEPIRPLSASWQGKGKPDGDLQTILAKALAKEAGRRYQSVGELAEDVERYLRNQPISARPPSALYQLKKMVVRNKAGFAAANLGLLLLASFSIAMWFQAERIAEQRDLAEQARIEAQRQARTTDAVNSFLIQDLIGAASPEISLGQELTVREVVDQAASRVGEALADDPIVESAVRRALGNTYEALGNLDRAEVQLRKSIELNAQAAGQDASSSLAIKGDLAWLLMERGEVEAAEDLLREVLDAQIRQWGADDARTLETRHRLANCLDEQNHLEEAEKLARSTLLARTQLLGADAPATLRSMATLALVLEHRGELEEAERIGRRAVELHNEVLGSLHPFTLATLTNLAMVVENQERHEEAKVILLDVLERHKTVNGPEHPNTLDAMNNLGIIYHKLDDLEAAEDLQRLALEIRQRVLGVGHRKTLETMANLANVLRTAERFDDAEIVLAELVGLARPSLGPDHWLVPAFEGEYASILAELGRREQAEPLLLKSFDELLRLVGKDHWRTGAAALYLTEFYEASDRPELADPYRPLVPTNKNR